MDGQNDNRYKKALLLKKKIFNGQELAGCKIQ